MELQAKLQSFPNNTAILQRVGRQGGLASVDNTLPSYRQTVQRMQHTRQTQAGRVAVGLITYLVNLPKKSWLILIPLSTPLLLHWSFFPFTSEHGRWTHICSDLPSSPTNTEGKVLAPSLLVTGQACQPNTQSRIWTEHQYFSGQPKTRDPGHDSGVTSCISVVFLFFTALLFFFLRAQELSAMEVQNPTRSPALSVWKTPPKPSPKYEQWRITSACRSRACWWC